MTSSPLIQVKGITKKFRVPRRGGGYSNLTAVNNISLNLYAGETLAIVGESGCGKTTLAHAIPWLVPPTSGSVLLESIELGKLSKSDLRQTRRNIQMVFQDPYGSLNPRQPIGAAISEPLAIYRIGTSYSRRDKVAALMEAVGLRPEDANRYPHQFSGGQRQRVAIARAIALNPKIIVADEPVSALDVSVQSQVLNLMADLKEAHRLTFLFISHDLTVVRHFANRVAVMYLGKIVEEGPVADLLENPKHPYTQALIEAVPKIGQGKRKPGSSLQGDVPSPLNPPNGCKFHPRCPIAIDQCKIDEPHLKEGVACHLARRGP
jgi:peptide/nickel transport system ATP-binding protein/oligopeptide transport system ATP-binding protein